VKVWADREDAAMLAAVFSFRGRLNRRQYFLGSLAAGAVLAMLGALFIGFIELAPTSRPTLAMSLNAVLLVIAAPLAVLSALSLQARRLRDVGLEPLIVIPLWIGSLGVAQSLPVLALSINLVLLAGLYAWPGRRDGASSISGGGILAFAPISTKGPASRRSLSSGRRWR
jgi:uncharacterized membrane protein YhaH (DUF805 family)